LICCSNIFFSLAGEFGQHTLPDQLKARELYGKAMGHFGDRREMAGYHATARNITVEFVDPPDQIPPPETETPLPEKPRIIAPRVVAVRSPTKRSVFDIRSRTTRSTHDLSNAPAELLRIRRQVSLYM
jgi:hypothetical protein